MENKRKCYIWNNHKRNLFIVFFVTIIYYCVWYSFLMPIVRCIVSSDEFLSLAIGITGFSDFDWNALVGKVQRYYGNGYTILFTPIMSLIKSSYWRYFIMHVANSVLHGFVGVICYKIYTRYLYRPDSAQAIIVALTASLFYFEGLEGTNIFNELPLYFTVWLVLIELLWLNKIVNDSKKKALGTFIMCITLVYSILLHTRAIFTIGAIIVTVVLVYVIYKKVIVNIVVFIGTLGIGYFLSELVSDTIRAKLWDGEITQNTVEGAFGSTGVFSKFSLLFSDEGIKGFLATLIGRLFGLFATSGGLLCIGFVIIFMLFYRLRKVYITSENEEITNFRIAILFLGVIIGASFFLFGLNASASVSTALNEETITYWPFYLRYHILYFIPLLPFVYASLEIFKTHVKRIILTSLGCFFLTKTLTIFLLSPMFVTESLRYRSKIVYYAFLPFTLKSGKDLIGDEMILSNLMISTILIILHSCLLLKNKIKCSCFVSIATSIYLFAYVMIKIFIPESNVVYSKTDQIYEFMKTVEQEDVKTDNIYYVGFSHLEAEVLQFDLPHWKLSDDYSSLADKNCIIVSNRSLKKELEQFGEKTITCYEVDEKEYIYFVGIKIEEEIR